MITWYLCFLEICSAIPTTFYIFNVFVSCSSTIVNLLSECLLFVVLVSTCFVGDGRVLPNDDPTSPNVVITVGSILSFITGSDTLPPLGFEDQPEIRTWPNSVLTTCTLCGRIVCREDGREHCWGSEFWSYLALDTFTCSMLYTVAIPLLAIQVLHFFFIVIATTLLQCIYDSTSLSQWQLEIIVIV